MIKKLLIYIILLLAFSTENFSQSGIKFLEFAKRLEPYFDEALINDIKSQLPQSYDFTIWGYDVGDFSGDDNSDVALALRIAGDKRSIMQVYLFVDIDGFLKQVENFEVPFIELPLEVGVVIRSNKCYVTQKYKQFNWDILGYTYNNGCLIFNDLFSTRKIGYVTYEKYRDYVNLKGYEKYISLKTNKDLFYRDFMTIPAYSRGRTVYKGIENSTKVFYTDYVNEGAYWWHGPDDCSYKITSSYDDEFLYFTINIQDDNIVIQNCDSCIADGLDLWFDINQYANGDRFAERNEEKIEYRTKSKNGIFRFTVFPGDFLNLPAYCKVSSTDILDDDQKYESKNIKVISNITDDGYVVKFKIPFSLLGMESNIPNLKNRSLEYGATFVVTDYDNEFRPEEKTEIATSQFKPLDPSTYSMFVLIPDGQWYGNSRNIFIDDIIKNLLGNGF